MSTPYLLFVLRFFGPVILLVLWVFYQLGIKKKPIKLLLNDAVAASFFVVIWGVISYCLFK